ncbi:MAG: NADH dehydrogenase [Anaerolineales bacterium]|nr:NADH dehydrogenase [Anaerolineales bacterium]
MTLIPDEERRLITEDFEAELSRPVKILMFTQEFECEFCKQTRQLVEELSELSDNVTLEVYDFIADEDVAAKYNVDKIPAIVILDEEGQDAGIHFYGIPSGYEFASLLEAVKLAGTDKVQLSDDTLEQLETIQEPVHIQVFVTPTCPYCPRAVVLGHQLAYASSWVRADMVEATEFPHLSQKYSVMGVPRTVINEDTHVEGAVPEEMLMPKLMQALSNGR